MIHYSGNFFEPLAGGIPVAAAEARNDWVRRLDRQASDHPLTEFTFTPAVYSARI